MKLRINKHEVKSQLRFVFELFFVINNILLFYTGSFEKDQQECVIPLCLNSYPMMMSELGESGTKDRRFCQ